MSAVRRWLRSAGASGLVRKGTHGVQVPAPSSLLGALGVLPGCRDNVPRTRHHLGTGSFGAGRQLRSLPKEFFP